MELPIAGMLDVRAMCSFGVKNYHVCYQFCATGSQDVVWLILVWWFLMLKKQCVCGTDGVSQGYLAPYLS